MMTLFDFAALLPEAHWSEAHHVSTLVEYLTDGVDLTGDNRVDELDYEQYLNSRVQELDKRAIYEN